MFNKFDFNFEEIMVQKQAGKKRGREMMMSSTTTSVVNGQMVGKRQRTTKGGSLKMLSL